MELCTVYIHHPPVHPVASAQHALQERARCAFALLSCSSKSYAPVSVCPSVCLAASTLKSCTVSSVALHT